VDVEDSLGNESGKLFVPDATIEIVKFDRHHVMITPVREAVEPDLRSGTAAVR
jgi:hypothetical protein